MPTIVQSCTPILIAVIVTWSCSVSAQAQSLDAALKIVEQAVGNGSIPGASVLVMRHGNVVVQRTYGVCEIEPSRPFENNTICWIASLTKPVTATAVMKLVEQGAVELDAPVETYLPRFAQLATKDGRRSSITVRQLMSHSAGIPASVPLREPYFFAPNWLNRPLVEVVDEIATRPLEFRPGSQVLYSNAAPYVLARIVEVRSGKSFGDWVRTEIIEPLQLVDTGFSIPASQAHRAAVVYRRENNQALSVFCRYDPAWKVTMTMPDGGLFSTPFDIARFANSFLDVNKGVLQADTVEVMLTPQSPGYGLGWILDRKHQFSHWGSSGTLVWADQKTGVVGVFFAQLQDLKLLANLRERFRDAVDQAFVGVE